MKHASSPIICLLLILLTGSFWNSSRSRAADTQPLPKVPLKNGDQILFIGDSITQAGLYAALIQTWLWSQYPKLELDIINLGLNGETASGNSEPDHPYPRAHIHERLERILKNTNPDVVFICYGMNDGIYHPFSEKHFADYRNGITRLIDKLEKSGRKIILLSSPPFDLFTFRQRHPVAPKNAPADFSYSYKIPTQAYDEVLKKYGEWIIEPKAKVTAAVDLHSPLNQLIKDRRAAEPDYKFGDGIHPPPEGHFEMALSILDSLGADRKQAEALLIRILSADTNSLSTPTPLWTDIQKRHRLLTVAWIEHVGHMKPNKAKALPLKEAQMEASRMEVEIRRSLADSAAK